MSKLDKLLKPFFDPVLFSDLSLSLTRTMVARRHGMTGLSETGDSPAPAPTSAPTSTTTST